MSTKRHIFSALLAAAVSFTAVNAEARSKKSHVVKDGYSAAVRVKGVATSRKYVPTGYTVKAQNRTDNSYRGQFVQRSISPAEAKSIARKRVPGGEVVDIKRRGDTYSVRVIKKSGKVVDVLIDANTGRVK